jgi:transcriptional regulator with XRE-family HTH domain
MPLNPSTAHGVWQELRVLRTKDNRSLTSLAADAEMSLSYLSDLERGRQLPSAEATRKLAAALNVPMSVLERKRLVDEDGNDIALRDLIRSIVLEELAKAAA